MKLNSTILITGAGSFIAGHLRKVLEERGYGLKFLTRQPAGPQEYRWDVAGRWMDDGALDDVDGIVHLAGSKLNDGTPLTPERQRLVYDSRIGAAEMLLEKLRARGQQIRTFVSASAIGYYGFTDRDLEIDEGGSMGTDFSAKLSHDWEAAADEYLRAGVARHVAKVRVSLVLGNEGGIFPIYRRMVEERPEMAARGGQDGSLPWNHVEDMAGIFAHVLEHSLDGVYNSVAPVPATTDDLLRAIHHEMRPDGGTLHLPPYQGQHLISRKIQAAGYVFRHPEIAGAVRDLIRAHGRRG